MGCSDKCPKYMETIGDKGQPVVTECDFRIFNVSGSSIDCIYAAVHKFQMEREE